MKLIFQQYKIKKKYLQSNINFYSMTKRVTLAQQQFQLEYQYKSIEGQSKLLAIIPIHFNKVKFVIFVILCFLTIGILLLFAYWFKKLTYKMYYNNVSIEQATHVCIQNQDNSIQILQIQQKLLFDGIKNQQICFFENRYLKYKIQLGTVSALCYYQTERIYSAFGNGFKGWSQNQAQKMLETYGPGAMQINRLTPCKIFVSQFFKPLYMFLLFSIYLNILNDYYLFVYFIALSVIIGIILTIVEMMDVNKKIFQMSFYQVFLNVLRDGSIKNISSRLIVPGDIVFLNSQLRLPFEAVILEGQLLMNQCVLTGQSVPVMKIGQGADKNEQNQMKINKNAYVFEGTTIVQINKKKKMKFWQSYKQQYGTPVCVVRTNFTTLKGQLIRKILYPIQLQNKFQKESYKAILFLAIVTFVSYAFLAIRMTGIVKPFVIVKKGFDLITIVIPPTIPISMTVGIIYAMRHMKKKNIFTIAPNRIVDGGMLNHLCFDKTGTLTHDFMQFKTLIPSNNKSFDKPIDASGDYSQNNQPKIYGNMIMILANMASNHTVISLQEKKQYVGDPMEIKLLQFSECTIFNDENELQAIFNFKGPHFHGRVLERFQFQSQLQRMSVVVQLSDKKIYVFTKGSPQILTTIANKQTLPHNYNQKMKEFASLGYRILAIASRQVDKNWKQLQRKQLQKDLCFNGFEVFENGLKDQTIGAILELRRVNIDPVIITGDNSLTAANIGYQSAILDTDTKALIVDYSGGNFTQQQFVYKPQNRPSYNLNRIYSQKKQMQVLNLNDPQLQYVKKLINKVSKQNYNICITGGAFNKLYSNQLQSQETLNPLKKSLLEYIKVFARTKPYDKSNIVKSYQLIEKVVGMCGDGANDCAALSQANIGLSLSDTQASIAASFTSKARNIGSMVQLIKQCRAGLITNYSLFNIVIVYALIQYASTIICQYFVAYPPTLHFIYWDLCLNLVFVSIIGNIATSDRLSKQIPPSTLFNLQNLISLGLFHILQFATQVLTIVLISGPLQDMIDYYSVGGTVVNQRKYLASDGLNFLTLTPQTNVIFVVSNFLYLHSIFSNIRCLPWKKPIYSYWLLNLVYIVLYLYSICIAVFPSLRLTSFKLTLLKSQKLNFILLAIGIGMGLFTVMIHFIIINVFKWHRQSKQNNLQLQQEKS